MKFNCRVSDGKFKPEYLTIYIKIEKVVLNVTMGHSLFLKQGSNIAYVSSEHFVIKTNANFSRIYFRIVEKPKYGLIYLNDDDKKHEFSYEDLVNNYVMYMQTNMLAFNDIFKVMIGVRNTDRKIAQFIDVIIKIIPLIDSSDIMLTINEKRKLNLANLDATLLAEISNDNPKYEIVEKPNFITFKKIIRISGEKKHISNNNLSIFSHEEIKSGLIYLVASPNDNGHYTINGNIIFKLSAIIFQPAIVELNYRIKLSNKKIGRISNFNFYQDRLFISLSVLITVVITLIIVIWNALMRCHKTFKNPKFNNNDNDNLNNNLGTIMQPLPKPPDQLSLVIAENLIPKQYCMSADNVSIPTTSFTSQMSAPHCRITNLQRRKKTSSFSYESDTSDINFQNISQKHQRDDLFDTWSDYTTITDQLVSINVPQSCTPNIMLRKNQYWV